MQLLFSIPGRISILPPHVAVEWSLSRIYKKKTEALTFS